MTETIAELASEKDILGKSLDKMVKADQKLKASEKEFNAVFKKKRKPDGSIEKGLDIYYNIL